MTQIDRDGKHILLAVLAELEVFSTLDETLFEKGNPYVWNVRHVGIPYCPAVWFGGRLSAGRRKSLTRATRKLTRKRLVRRVTEKRRDRLTHLRLTPDGFSQALQLADQKVEWQQLVESLAWIEWADDLWQALDQYPPALEIITATFD